jgi:hypothetical protein
MPKDTKKESLSNPEESNSIRIFLFNFSRRVR